MSTCLLNDKVTDVAPVPTWTFPIQQFINHHPPLIPIYSASDHLRTLL